MAREDQLDNMEKTLNSIYVLLHGSRQDSEPDGLVQRVKENTRFREGWHRFFWLLLTAFLGLGGSLALLIMKAY